MDNQKADAASNPMSPSVSIQLGPLDKLLVCELLAMPKRGRKPRPRASALRHPYAQQSAITRTVSRSPSTAPEPRSWEPLLLQLVKESREFEEQPPRFVDAEADTEREYVRLTSIATDVLEPLDREMQADFDAIKQSVADTHGLTDKLEFIFSCVQSMLNYSKQSTSKMHHALFEHFSFPFRQLWRVIPSTMLSSRQVVRTSHWLRRSVLDYSCNLQGTPASLQRRLTCRSSPSRHPDDASRSCSHPSVTAYGRGTSMQI